MKVPLVGIDLSKNTFVIAVWKTKLEVKWENTKCIKSVHFLFLKNDWIYYKDG